MKKNNTNRIFACCLMLWSVYCGSAYALQSDGDQPIVIDSNTATYDDAKAISIYTGNVISIQGSIRVNSDKLVVYFINGEADKMVFTGNLAKFKQTPKDGDQDITGEAYTGEFYPKKNLLKAKMLEAVWPQYAKTVIRFNRHHHLVDWRIFSKK